MRHCLPLLDCQTDLATCHEPPLVVSSSPEENLLARVEVDLDTRAGGLRELGLLPFAWSPCIVSPPQPTSLVWPWQSGHLQTRTFVVKRARWEESTLSSARATSGIGPSVERAGPRARAALRQSSSRKESNNLHLASLARNNTDPIESTRLSCCICLYVTSGYPLPPPPLI